MGYRFFNTCQILADTAASLPAKGSFVGQFAYVEDTDLVYAWDGAAWNTVGSGGAGAPTTADYLVKTADAGLSAERVVGDSTTVTANWATPGAVSFERAALSGDVSASANSNTTSIGNDKVTEAMLKAVNAPTDEYPLTYESTTGDFEWQQLTSTGIADNAVTPAKLDDGSALSVLGRSANSAGDRADIAGSTVGHVLQVLAGPTVGFGLAPIGTAVYNPDAGPSGTWGDEEFAGGAESLTWRWGNQGSSTITFHNDVASLFTPNSTTSIRARWLTPPSGSFTIVAKVWQAVSATLNLGGITILETGSEATPTTLSGFFIQAKSTSPWGNYSAFTKTSYTSAYTSASNDMGAETGYNALPMYMMATYDTGTGVLRYWWGHDGIDFRSVSTSPFKRTLGGDPVSVGYFVDANNNTANTGTVLGVSFFRVWNSVIITEYLTDRLCWATIGS